MASVLQIASIPEIAALERDGGLRFAFGARRGRDQSDHCRQFNSLPGRLWYKNLFASRSAIITIVWHSLTKLAGNDLSSYDEAMSDGFCRNHDDYGSANIA